MLIVVKLKQKISGELNLKPLKKILLNLRFGCKNRFEKYNLEIKTQIFFIIFKNILRFYFRNTLSKSF